jgi:Asp/Glu/hydantoin racemase
MTEMSKQDWQVTSFTTNIAESAHAMAQRDGKKLSLLAAVLKGKNIDLRFLHLQRATFGFGVTAHYGNTFMTGRKMLALARQKSKARKKAMRNNENLDELSDNYRRESDG